MTMLFAAVNVTDATCQDVTTSLRYAYTSAGRDRFRIGNSVASDARLWSPSPEYTTNSAGSAGAGRHPTSNALRTHSLILRFAHGRAGSFIHDTPDATVIVTGPAVTTTPKLLVARYVSAVLNGASLRSEEHTSELQSHVNLV